MPLSPRPTRLAFGLTLAALASLPRPSLAQSRATDVAAAQELFDEARGLAHAGKFAEACPKFEESERLDAGPGTEFNLADCYEHAGRTASAWAQFMAVADSLHAIGQREREKIARDRARALEAKLSKLAVNVGSGARVSGLEVKRDGVILGDAQWGSGVPVDPGKHVILAAAPGRQTWQQTVVVGADGKNVTVDVPALDIAQTPALERATPAEVPTSNATPSTLTTPEAEGSAAHGMDGQKIAALVAGGIGVVALGIGGYFGSQAISKHNQYVPNCPNNVCSDPSYVQIHNDASTDATYATVGVTVGAVAVVGAVLLYVTAPGSRSASTRQGGVQVLPAMTARGGELLLRGAW
jgi:hypothetical protein